MHIRRIVVILGLALALVPQVEPSTAAAADTLVCERILGADHVEALVSIGSASACAQDGMTPLDETGLAQLQASAHTWCEIDRGNVSLLYLNNDAHTAGQPEGVLGPNGLRLASISECEGLALGIDFERTNGVDSSAATTVQRFYDS